MTNDDNADIDPGGLPPASRSGRSGDGGKGRARGKPAPYRRPKGALRLDDDPSQVLAVEGDLHGRCQVACHDAARTLRQAVDLEPPVSVGLPVEDGGSDRPQPEPRA